MYLETDSPIDLGNGNNAGLGNGGGWWILIILLAMFGGCGFGGGYGYGGGGAMNGYALTTDFATLERKLDSVNNGICDLGFNLSNTVTQGFAGLNTALVTQGYETRNAVTDVGYAIKDCCCQVNYNLATNFANLSNTICSATRDIVDNQNANYRALHDEIVANKIEAKNERIAELTMQLNRADLRASQEAQNAYLLSELKPCGKPAYVVQPPQPVTFPTNCCGNVNYANYGFGCCNSVQ